MTNIYKFEGNGKDFSATYEAEKFLKEAGFSVGSMQGREPRGVLHGDYLIAKWRNLSEKDRDDLDGVMLGDGRNGPITVNLKKPIEDYK